MARTTPPARHGGRGMSEPPRQVSRRELLRAGGLVAAGVPMAGLLASCARETPAATTSKSLPGLKIASPANPVTWPIAPDNQPIASGLSPEKGATLRLYNYADYIDPATIKAFGKEFDAKVEVTTFNDIPEALAKIRSGSVDFDIFFPSYDVIGKIVTTGLVQPLNHDYIPNIANAWPEFTDPFYDGGWQYSAPYAIFTTGIAWRTDEVSEDISQRANPWDVFWDPQYAGKISVLDDYRETIGLSLLHQGMTDINTADDAALAKVQTDLLALAQATRPKVTINHYTELPEGRFGISHAWSGDVVNMQYYLPEGGDPGVFRFWFPEDGKGPIGSDTMVVLRSAKNPVLAHEFLNFMLDTDNAMTNFGFTGYQPPQVSVTPETLVQEGYIPENVSTATVLDEYFTTGYRHLELPPDVDEKWTAVWQRFKAGG